MLPQKAVRGESCLGTHWLTVTLMDINGLTDLMINIYYDETMEKSPPELYGI